MFADAAIAGRNDLLPANEGGQRKAWTGKIEPIWPSNGRGESGSDVAGGAVEQGQVLSHISGRYGLSAQQIVPFANTYVIL